MAKPAARKLAASLFLWTGLSASMTVASAPQSPKQPTPLSPETRARVRQAMAAVGLVLVRRAGEFSNQVLRPRGSAVVVRSEGLVLTNNHVITDDRTGRPYDEIYFSLSEDNAASARRYRLRAVLINKEHDLALLNVIGQADGGPLPNALIFPTIEIGDSRNVQPLDDLIIIGFPEKGGSGVTVNRGVVEGKDQLGNWIKTDARVMHGNSGGAAVNTDGRLIGIPTKVIADSQPIDRDGDGFPDGYRTYGAVGFLRPAHLVTEMLARLGSGNSSHDPAPAKPAVMPPPAGIKFTGTVKSSADGKPIAGATVGLIPAGAERITEATLLTWGGTNAEGHFVLNKPVPPGRYSLRAKALGYEAYARDIEVRGDSAPLVVELRPR